MTFNLRHCLIGGILAIVVMGCKKKTDDPSHGPDPVFKPTVTTSPVSTITAATAIAGGTVTADGGDPVKASGVCWSKTNTNPTIADDTIKTSVTMGDFTGQLKNLSPSTTYFVRAYAYNTVGVSYGNAVSFNSLNKAPEAQNSIIIGNINVSQKLVARYKYVDAENDAEGATSFQWYIANDTTGSPLMAITNATDSIYTIQQADMNKFLQVAITPKARTGSSPGTEVKSFWVGPVKAPLTVTFVYNGNPVTYGIITSTTTQRQWLDRNLGAPNSPTAFNDWANEGDLFQWGRPADGHQLINRAATTPGTTAVNGTTTTLSTSAIPGHSLFIMPANDPFDWHVPQSDKLWQVTGGDNNACPAGWHVPTTDEWKAESLGNVQDAYAKLKITVGGQRFFLDGSFSLTLQNGAYWTSSVFNGVNLNAFSFQFATGSAAIPSTASLNANGLSVRCIKNQ